MGAARRIVAKTALHSLTQVLLPCDDILFPMLTHLLF